LRIRSVVLLILAALPVAAQETPAPLTLTLTEALERALSDNSVLVLATINTRT